MGAVGIWIFCSLLASALAADVETQESKLTLDMLRKENAGLRQADAARQREFASVTNELARVQAKLGNPHAGLIADDDEARTAMEWRSFLQSALKVLGDADREVQDLRKRLQKKTSL